VGFPEARVTEPFVPTGREFDDGNLPRSEPVRSPRSPREGSADADAHRVHDFVLEVSPSVDTDLFER
jgi:hypothetical protein